MFKNKDSNLRIKIGYFIWAVLLGITSTPIMFFATSLIFYCIGGFSYVLDVWNNKVHADIWPLLASIPPSVHLGAKLATFFWKKLMRLTGFISDEQAHKMMG